MKKKKEVLAESFYNYLTYDQAVSTKWQSPFSDNSDYHNMIRKVADKMADVAMHEFRRELRK